ncbi:MAG: hypothetical protein ABEJ56_02480 [Candidatus Nanohaloarchaea archaeon]
MAETNEVEDFEIYGFTGGSESSLGEEVVRKILQQEPQAREEEISCPSCDSYGPERWTALVDLSNMRSKGYGREPLQVYSCANKDCGAVFFEK